MESRGQKLIVTSTEHGKPKRLSFPWSLAGLEEAKVLNVTYRKEVRKHGTDFGNITEDEKRVLALWRQYTKEAMANSPSMPKL